MLSCSPLGFQEQQSIVGRSPHVDFLTHHAVTNASCWEPLSLEDQSWDNDHKIQPDHSLTEMTKLPSLSPALQVPKPCFFLLLWKLNVLIIPWRGILGHQTLLLLPRQPHWLFNGFSGIWGQITKSTLLRPWIWEICPEFKWQNSDLYVLSRNTRYVIAAIMQVLFTRHHVTVWTINYSCSCFFFGSGNWTQVPVLAG
jgi:hypothetical protein